MMVLFYFIFLLRLEFKIAFKFFVVVVFFNLNSKTQIKQNRKKICLNKLKQIYFDVDHLKKKQNKTKKEMIYLIAI